MNVAKKTEKCVTRVTAPFLLVLTKMDHSYRQMRNEALLMLQMKRLQQEIPQHVTIVEASAISGQGRDAILRWITDG
ncbi:hypothetical protein HUJ05_007568 [Dendroctonus ponderosae]|nr:hypothetical protein HUJ05_007568 [Dendroctonus ponderosae]